MPTAPRVDQVAIDWRVLPKPPASLATALLCSLAPLSHLAKVDAMHAIKDAHVGGRWPQLPPPEPDEKRGWSSPTFAALTVPPVGAGLLVRSFVLRQACRSV